MADIPGITVTGVSPVPYDYTTALLLQLQLNEYLARAGATARHDPYVPPGGFDTLPTVTVTAKKPPPPPLPTIEYEGEPEYYTDPDTGLSTPTWAMNDTEYAQYLGGGDIAYEQMWEERHTPFELDYEDMFVPTPVVPTFRPSTPTTTLPTNTPQAPGVPRGPAGPQIGDPNYRWTLFPNKNPPGPNIPPGQGALPPWAFWARLLPSLAAIFQPLTPGRWFEDVAPRYPLEFQPFPIELPVPDVRFDPSVRPGPGVADPFGLPNDPFATPQVLPEVVVRPATPTRPSTLTPDPFLDPFTAPLDPTRPNIRFEPSTPRVFQGIPQRRNPPRTSRPPVDLNFGIDTPPLYAERIRIPWDQPRPLQPPVGVDTIVDALPDPFIPLTGPGSPLNANPCGCAPQKKKERKKQEPRTVCYEGKFREYTKGTSKFSRKRIPCDSKTIDTVKKAAKRKKVPSLPDLAKDVFGIPSFRS